MRPLSYPRTDVFLLVYSVVDLPSFENLRSKWYPEISQHCPNVPFLLVGTKIDLREDGPTLEKLAAIQQFPVAYNMAVSLAQEIGAFKVLECSALTQQGLKNVFEEAMCVAGTIPQQPSTNSNASQSSDGRGRCTLL